MNRNDHSDQKTLNKLTCMLNRLISETKTKSSKEESSSTPIAKRLRTSKYDPEFQNSKLDGWLTKKGVISSPVETKISGRSGKLLSNKNAKNEVKMQYKPLAIKSEKTVKSKESISRKKKTSIGHSKISGSRTSTKVSSPKTQSTLNSFFSKQTSKMTFQRNDSSDSCELPNFDQIKRKESKKSRKAKEQKALFNKYGVVLPTVEEMLRDKEELERYKNKIESFIPMNENSLELPFLEGVVHSPVKEKGVDCKHTTNEELTKYFEDNISFLSDIFNEKVKNNRHDRYFDKNYKSGTLSARDLTYNTSTIVFNYEQIDYLMDLLRKQFDPDDTKTQYFFQVLLPELCLRIFMETHKMSHEEAVQYLDERPILD